MGKRSLRMPSIAAYVSWRDAPALWCRMVSLVGRSSGYTGTMQAPAVSWALARQPLEMVYIGTWQQTPLRRSVGSWGAPIGGLEAGTREIEHFSTASSRAAIDRWSTNKGGFDAMWR